MSDIYPFQLLFFIAFHKQESSNYAVFEIGNMYEGYVHIFARDMRKNQYAIFQRGKIVSLSIYFFLVYLGCTEEKTSSILL